MNNKKPKLSKNNIATAKRLLKYVTETYKARFILVFICIFLSAVASIAVSLSLKYMLDDFILPLIGQKSPNYTEFYRALAVLGCIFLVGVIATFIYTRMMVYIGQADRLEEQQLKRGEDGHRQRAGFREPAAEDQRNQDDDRQCAVETVVELQSLGVYDGWIDGK